MENNYIATASITINAPVEKVWEASVIDFSAVVAVLSDRADCRGPVSAFVLADVGDEFKFALPQPRPGPCSFSPTARKCLDGRSLRRGHTASAHCGRRGRRHLSR